MENILGCDIGNGYGYISLLSDPNADPQGLLPAKYKELVHNGMPTAAYVTPPDGSEIVVFKDGKTAEYRYRTKPEQIIRAIKTRFKEGKITVPGISRPVDAEAVYASIARDLILLAEETLGEMVIDPVYKMVFTFPAIFADDTAILEKMQRSIESVEIGGKKLEVVGRLPEPAAVAIDYLHYMQHIAPEEVRITRNEYTVLVYDLGHGTFDTAVVTAKNDKDPYVLHSKAGLAEIGGKNFDEILYNEIMNVLSEKYQYEPRTFREKDLVRQEAVKVKIALSSTDIASAQVMHNGEFCEVEITRARFEELSSHLIFQTLELVQKVLEQAEEKQIKIDAIILSGGASQMPMVKNNLEQLVEGAFPVVLYRPSEAVSFGAARYAYGLPVLDQLTDTSYGMWMPSAQKLEGEVRFCIPTGKKRPFTAETLTFTSPSARISVKLYHAKENAGDIKTASPEDCVSMIWIPFDVTPGAVCEVTVTALENYGLQVELTTDKGEHYIKTTSDSLAEMI